MLTLKDLKEMSPDTIFASGETVDSPKGINMANTGQPIKWVAHRGGIHDWAIFTDNPYSPQSSFEMVARMGDKVHDESHIRKLVECDDAAFCLYNH